MTDTPTNEERAREIATDWVTIVREDHCAEAVTEAMISDITAALERVRREERRNTDAAYDERNRLVAFLASIHPSGIKQTNIEGWDPEWHGCVYIDLPTGQASWHFHVSQAHLFDHLGAYDGEWDGHTTEEKYERIAQAIRSDGGNGDG